ncbi:hypothetical protein BU26DRAFT_133091 [Trematosphaeria pertusa]|uniref:Uncharacterized protein n=1 Tax=Trematosphaeria pertusa TaxID=390896 RepID=A0A6A6HX51_9PLEO|nr:uncharacterized protein BU26DRAFT_133091 [Trematosphaeria pertusa]KAF2242784.1 hypothetical protein BU26DRAFT_133091 [Trematosphaeria pertusa]
MALWGWAHRAGLVWESNRAYMRGFGDCVCSWLSAWSAYGALVPRCGVLEGAGKGSSTNRGNPAEVESFPSQQRLQECTNACSARSRA